MNISNLGTHIYNPYSDSSSNREVKSEKSSDEVEVEKSYEEVKRGVSQRVIDKMIENLMKQKEKIVKQIKALKSRASTFDPTSPALLQLKALNSQLASIDAQILKAIQEREKLDKMA